MKKTLFILFVLIPFVSFAQFANASKCHSTNGKADARCTPGAINAKVTQANIHVTICVSGYTTKIRPSTSYTDKLKKQGIKDYGYSDTKLADYEEDHLIPLEIGGNPTDPKNLWAEPHKVSGNKGSSTKDKLENSLHSSVCKGTMTLKAAQEKILADWDSGTTTQSLQQSVPTKAPSPTTQHVTTPNTANNSAATALCNDGTYSYASSHRGACSKHGGVKVFYN